MHLRPMYSLFLTLSEQSIALRAPAVHGVSSNTLDGFRTLCTVAKLILRLLNLLESIGSGVYG